MRLMHKVSLGLNILLHTPVYSPIQLDFTLLGLIVVLKHGFMTLWLRRTIRSWMLIDGSLRCHLDLVE